MRMNVRRVISMFLAAMMIVASMAVFSACGNSSTDSSTVGTTAATQQDSAAAEQSKQDVYDNGLSKTDKVTLKVLAIEQGFGRRIYDYEAAKFMEMFPNVTVELTCNPQAGDLIIPKIAANNDDDMYDLIFTGQGYSKKLSDEGRVEDLNDFMNTPTWDDKSGTIGEDIMDSAKRLFAYNGKQDQLPTDISTISIIYNKKMFRENGWNENPKTWGEFLQLCETIKASQKAVPLAFGGTVGYIPWLTNLAGIYKGGQEWSEKFIKRDKGIYSDPASLEAMKKLKELVDKEYFLKGTEALDHTQSQMEFVQGKVAMVPCGSWIENEMKNSAPADFEYGAMLQPTNDNPVDVKYVQGYCWSLWAWAKKSDLNKQWAKEYIRYYYSKEIQGVLLQNGGISITKSTMNSDVTSKLASPFIQNVLKMLSGNVEMMLAFSLPAPKVSESPKLSDVDWKIFFPGFLSVYMGKKTPEEVGAEADAMLEEAWKDVGGR